MPPMCGEEAFLLLLFIVERQLFPQEGSAKSIFSISVICFSSTAPEELPLYLFILSLWTERGRHTEPALRALHGERVFHFVQP